MPRVVRILVYETETEEQMKEWLDKALADGKPHPEAGYRVSGTVTAYTLNSVAYQAMASKLSELEECYNDLAHSNNLVTDKL